MNEYFIFFTCPDGLEELGGSHYDLDQMISVIEAFLRTNQEREFLFVSACQRCGEGEIEELVRWERGSDVPVLDLRQSEAIY